MTNDPHTDLHLDEIAARVDRALTQARELSEPARGKALEIKSAIEEFHRDGLTRIVRHLRADPRGKELLLELAQDPAVYALFLMHGIVRGEEPEPAPKSASNGFVPLGNLTMAAGWKQGPPVGELVDGKPYRLEAGETSILILMIGGKINAFRNECAHQGLPLDGGMVDREACTITCPWHGFRFDAATGECITSPQAQLERIEMKVEAGRVQVRPA